MLELIKNLGKKKLYAIAAVAVVIFASLFSLIFTSSANRMEPLYYAVPEGDMYDIVRALSTAGESYIISDKQILVRSSRIRELRMLMASEGLPTTGMLVGYEIFNKEDALSTSNFRQNINLTRALEGELARTINSLDNIQHTRVHLVMPKRELFSQTKQRASASIVLKTKGKASLSNKQSDAIINLVASSVPGLMPQDITLVSTDGKSLRKGGEDGDTVSTEQQEYKLLGEKHLKGTIENLLASTLGEGRVKAEVSLEMNFDQLVVDSELFDPNQQVLRSSQVIEENTQNRYNNNNVSVENDIRGNNEFAQGGTSSSVRTDETRNFEISREKRQLIKKAGSIKRMSIAVMVDGMYNKDPTTGEEVYIGRNEETIQKIKLLVSSAVGFDASRGDVIEVIDMPFSRLPEMEHELEPDLYSILIEYKSIVYFLVVSLILFIAFIIFRPFLRSIFAPPKKVQAAASAPAASGPIASSSADSASKPDSERMMEDMIEEGILTGQLSDHSNRKVVEHINSLVEKYPEVATLMVRDLLMGNIPKAAGEKKEEFSSVKKARET